MSKQVRRARVRAPAKINLSLRVLHKRPDGFHELRTIFQTISVADILEIEYTPSAETRVEIDSPLDIPPEENLVVRAARAVLEAAGKTGQVRFRLDKRIPAGGGLGGGSSDAAAVLLALPVLCGTDLPLGALTALAAGLGSDVPFFLCGGTALGVGRGTEVYPLPEAPALLGLLVNPGVQVATPEAYQALGRELTPDSDSCNINSFQALVQGLDCGLTAARWASWGENDFAGFAFERYPRLNRIASELREHGAHLVMLSGSGATLFGIFDSRRQAAGAQASLRDFDSESFYLVSRGRYRRYWWRSLRGHLNGEQWPPRSRYAR